MRSWIAVGLCLAFVVVVAPPWYAQDGSTGAGVEVLIPSFIELTVVDDVFFVDLGTSVRGEDLEKRRANTLRIRTNSDAGWMLYIWTNDPDLGPLDQPNNPARKPVGDFSWSSNGRSGHLSHQRQLLAQATELSTDGKNVGNTVVNVDLDYLVDIKVTDPPGDFGVKLNFVVELARS